LPNWLGGITVINIDGNSYDNWDDRGILDGEQFASVTSCGYQKFITKNYTVAREKGRIDYQIIYIVEGKGCYTFEDGYREVEKGNIVLFLPSQPQNYTYYYKDKTELYWIHFSGYAVKGLLEKLGIHSQQVLYIGDNKECIELLKKTTYELQLKRPHFINYTCAYLIELLSSIARKLDDMSLESSITITEDIRKAILNMHMNYGKELSVKELAKECNLSLFRFIHKFKSSTGMTPLSYLIKVRMDVACELLSNSSLSVSEVASIVGYKDPLYFSKAFKKTKGVSPKNYKQRGL
jgi:AraC family transcriptional regulator, arabinose operon regulatory protein